MDQEKTNAELSTDNELNSLLAELLGAAPGAVGPEFMDLMVLEQLPEQYELIKKVNQGGMGAIFQAQNRYTGAHFAIKIMRPDAAADQNALKRFIVEARAMASLKHPNICQVYDFGLTTNKMPYLVMDWIDGISLGKKVERDHQVNPVEALRIFQQVASALGHAHQNKVVHRDLKPENIMLIRDADEKTVVKLVDFGIAKVLSDEENVVPAEGLTQAGLVIGTPLYMSPEQAKSLKLDARTDIYSLGCVMYFAVTGRPPFLGENIVDTIAKHVLEPPPEINPKLGVPPDFIRIILKAMEKERDDRYQTMDELASDLRKLSKGAAVQVKPLAREREASRKQKLTLVYFVVGFALMYAISIWLQGVLDNVPTKDSKTQNAPSTVAPKNVPAQSSATAESAKPKAQIEPIEHASNDSKAQDDPDAKP